MKKTLIVAGILASALSLNAQDVQQAAAEAAAAIANAPVEEVKAPKPNYWTKKASFDLGFNQTGLTNWAAGGYNTLTLAAGIDASANYKKGLMNWNNRLQLNYAFLHSADKKGVFQKSNDRIYLESKWGYDFSKTSKWKYTASFDFRSQFTDTPNKYVQDAEGNWNPEGLKSGFLSPAYTNLALGMEWKPAAWFDVNIAPLTGGVILTTNDILRKAYGMHLKDEAVPDVYRSALFQFGAQVKVNAKASLNDKLTYDTQLVLFTDYLSNPFVFTRVNWDNKLAWQATQFFKVGFNTWLIYDPLVVIDGVTSKIQFKEFFLVSFTYTISGKKK